MKNTKVCPKCSSKSIAVEMGTRMYTRDFIPAGAFKTIMKTKYICLDCGFIEEWIEPKDLDALRRKHGK